MTAPLFFGFGFQMALSMAVESDSPLIRWAAQSAEISLQLMPHTFSVYVLKKILKSRLPNLLLTHSSKFFGFATGKQRALRYDSMHRPASRMPSFLSASPPLSG